MTDEPASLSLLLPERTTPPDAVAAAAAARLGLAVATLPPTGRFRIHGEDRAKFLHGQCTQVVKDRPCGDGGAAFVLDARGQVISDLRFTIEAAYIACECPRAQVQPLLAWLERWIITADVRLEDRTADECGWHVTGPGAASALARALGTLPDREDSSVVVTMEGATLRIVGNDLTGQRGFDVIVANDQTAVAAAALRPVLSEATPLSPAALEILRVEGGRPSFGVDIDQDVLPKETGQEGRAVSYTKGCYAGQEVVAKQHFLGKPRKLLHGLVCQCATQVGAVVRLPGGSDLGHVTSVAISPTLKSLVGLAVLKGPGVPPGTRLEVVCKDAFVTATVHALPFCGQGATPHPTLTSPS